PNGSIYGGNISHASVASNGANATFGGAAAVAKWRAPSVCKIVSAFWEAEGADTATNDTDSFRTLQLIDGGADATGTVVLASLNLTATLASNTQRAMTVITAVNNPNGYNLDAGDTIYASHFTVGAARAADTELKAGTFRFYYMPI
ncbi:hypothetical protein LCGC14_1468920, partial [marine sediment metagenome]